MLEFLSMKQTREQSSGGLPALGQVASSPSQGNSWLGLWDDPSVTCPSLVPHVSLWAHTFQGGKQ